MLKLLSLYLVGHRDNIEELSEVMEGLCGLHT